MFEDDSRLDEEIAREDKKIFESRIIIIVIASFIVAAQVLCGAGWYIEKRRISAQVEANPSCREKLRGLVPGTEGMMFFHCGISRKDVALAIFDLRGNSRGRRQGATVLIDGNWIFASRTSSFAFPFVKNGLCLFSFGGNDFKVITNGAYRFSLGGFPRFVPDEGLLELVTAALVVLNESAASEV